MAEFNNVLAIETSCDDTSVAIIDNKGFVKGMMSANQDFCHRPFGGIVPEIASRNHTLNTLPLMEEVLKKCSLSLAEIDGFAVTNRPGLVGSLLVGLVTVKTLSLITTKPFVCINHLEGHLLAPFLSDSQVRAIWPLPFPCIGLVISGGHTSIYLMEGVGKYRIIGSTIDDAAGEAFDKFAKMLGFEYPGGVKIDQLSGTGDVKAFTLPRALIKEDSLNFSFSGLKTAGQRLLAKMSVEEQGLRLADLCASFQEAVVDALMIKLDLAVKMMKVRNVVISGGVSANSRLRQRASEWAIAKKLQLHIPSLRYCTDNAAMIGYAGLLRLQIGQRASQTIGASPASYDDDFAIEYN